MRIDSIRVKNFRGFVEERFTFGRLGEASGSFHVFIGDNATGKTAILEALTVAAGSWFLGVRGHGGRNITERDIRVRLIKHGDRENFEDQYPVEVEATGIVQGHSLSWTREITNKDGKTRWVKAKRVKELAEEAVLKMQNDETVLLPLVCYFSTQRLWKEPKDMFDYYRKGGESLEGSTPMQAMEEINEPLDLGDWFKSRLAGYNFSLDPRSSSKELVRWLRMEEMRALQRREESQAYRIVRAAITATLEHCIGIRYDVSLGLLALFEGHGELPFHLLSDGQRNTLALVGDLAYKAAHMNPHLGDETLQKVNGVVLIDEIDLHLHPNWQRHIVNSLRNVFPAVQFIATTHSPFIVQTLREGELISLDKETVPKTENLSIAAIAKGLMGVEEISEKVMGVSEPDASPRYHEMKKVATDYLLLLQEAQESPAEKLQRYKEMLASKLVPYSDNPAFQAILELERVSKLGS